MIFYYVIIDIYYIYTIKDKFLDLLIYRVFFHAR